MKRRQLIQAGIAATVAQAGFAHADTWPSKPVQLVCAFPPGSGVDFTARMLSKRLSATLGQQFVVVNRPGAAGTVAAGSVAASAPDGYTFLMNSASQTLYPAMYPDLKFDATRDTVGVACISEVELFMVVPAERGWNNLRDFLAYAKSAPNGITFASAGHGSSTHVGFERFAHAANLKRLHIPTKGTPESVAEVASGRVDACYGVAASAMAMINAKKLTPIAIAGAQRSGLLPNVPTTVEVVPNSGYMSWIGVLAPKGLPPGVIERLDQEIAAAVSQPEFGAELRQAGQVPMLRRTPEFATQLRNEYTDNAAVVKAAGIKAG